MRTAVPFLFGLLLGACAGQPTPMATAPTAPSTPSHVEAAAELESKTVALVHGTDEGTQAYCSGVWVSGISILTARHCVEEANAGDSVEYVVRSDVYVPGEPRVREPILTRMAKVHVLDEAHDLALLRAFNAPMHGVATTTPEPVRPGAFAQTMGHSLSLWWSYSSGDVAAVRQVALDLDLVWIQATTPISRGNSGCGLFDEHGHLMGIAHGGLAYGQMLNFFVHGRYIDAFLGKQVAL
jgi:S1-C subfamily serine protease